MAQVLPYKIATLCYLFDADGKVLLLHRKKPPNHELYSPVGGKLDQSIGESPATCARREIQEETGLDIPPHQLHLTGIVSESGFEQSMHWLMFLYEVTVPVSVDRVEFEEGRLEWHEPEKITDLAIPQTDREVIWPLFWKYRRRFFSVYIDCNQKGVMNWRLEQPGNEMGPDVS